jgi:hypothetical protein
MRVNGTSAVEGTCFGLYAALAGCRAWWDVEVTCRVLRAAGGTWFSVLVVAGTLFWLLILLRRLWLGSLGLGVIWWLFWGRFLPRGWICRIRSESDLWRGLRIWSVCVCVCVSEWKCGYMHLDLSNMQWVWLVKRPSDMISLSLSLSLCVCVCVCVHE